MLRFWSQTKPLDSILNVFFLRHRGTYIRQLKASRLHGDSTRFLPQHNSGRARLKNDKCRARRKKRAGGRKKLSPDRFSSARAHHATYPAAAFRQNVCMCIKYEALNVWQGEMKKLLGSKIPCVCARDASQRQRVMFEIPR
jgi:hypothetical protein